MGDTTLNTSGKFGDTSMIELTGKIMVVAILLLFFVVVFVFCLHLYAKWFWYNNNRRETPPATTTRRRRRGQDFAAGHNHSDLRRGLDPSLLITIPVITFDPKEFNNELECAVCLSEVSSGENARLLPKCNHGFHVECIDMWFESHSTCPLCRNPVTDSVSCELNSESTVVRIPVVENSNFPTNVLFWGNETRVSTVAEQCSSSSTSGNSNRPDVILVVDVLGEVINEEEDEHKSPVPKRLKSLKRLLSGNRRVNPSSPMSLDIEQGGKGQS